MITPLTPEQQAFAEAHHDLILAFMHKHSLSAGYYGMLAERYLKVVVRYLADEELQRYAFSTVAWQHLRSELMNHARREMKHQAELPLETYDDVPIPTDEPFDAAMWEKIEDILTYKQYEVILLRNQGYTNDEIANLCGVKRKAIEKRFARIRKLLKNFKEF